MKARFRCDNCGHHVPLEHDTCPHCGRRFTAVVCPVCSFEGDASLFGDGCPSCGYRGAARRSGATAVARQRPGKARKPPLPAWFYLASSAVLLGVLILLLFLLLRAPR
jgi:hypothetical protein